LRPDNDLQLEFILWGRFFARTNKNILNN
jgi:hypothetical protein